LCAYRGAPGGADGRGGTAGEAVWSLPFIETPPRWWNTRGHGTAVVTAMRSGRYVSLSSLLLPFGPVDRWRPSWAKR